MKRMIWMPAVLAACVLLAGCGKTTTQESSPAAAETAAPVETQAGASAAESAVHITVQSVSISVEELKKQDYTVPLLVTLDQSPVLKYTEWGLHVDPKCTFTANSKGMDIQTVYAENAEEHFIWTAWAGENDEPGTLLEVQLKLPMDAAPGSTYPLTYANVSLAEKPHVWNDGNADLAETAGAVTWTDGGVTVTE